MRLLLLLSVAGLGLAQTETQHSTPGGISFKVPAGWTARDSGVAVILQPPETDTHIVITDTKESDAGAAVAAAWKVYKPEFARPLKLKTERPGREGWEQGFSFEYETSPNERAVAEARALRRGSAWTVILLDGTEPTFEKRSGPIGILVASVRPKSYVRESFASRTPLPLTPERVETLKKFVQDGMTKLGVPGAGMAFYSGSKVVWEGGLGVKEFGKPDPVDANTLFMAASNTKGMSTLLLAILADQGKLRWDQPVTQIYPAFKLGSADITRQVLMKNLVCACTGMPRQDFEWIFEYRNATPAASVASLASMQPTSKFGEVFQYSNIMASAAGYIGGHLYAPDQELGAAYDRAMQQLIFTPLAMNATTFDMAKALRGNYARPFADTIDGRPAAASMNPNYSVIPHRPAGGVWTSAHDLMRYVELELGKGVIDGKRIVSEANILERRKPQVPISEDQYYGMGLMTDQRYGVLVVHHGGSLFGYKSDLIFVPEAGIGVVLLTNSDNGQLLLGPLRRRLLEVLYDGKPEAQGNLDAAVASFRAGQAKERERLQVPAAPAETAQLAAAYHSPELGDLAVRKDSAATVFDLGEWRSEVASRKNDDGTTSFMTISPGLDGFEFVKAERGGRRALIVRDGQHEYIFSEVAK